MCLMPHASCPMPYAPCPMPHASCFMPHAPCFMPHAPCLMPHAPCPVLHTYSFQIISLFLYQFEKVNRSLLWYYVTQGVNTVVNAVLIRKQATFHVTMSTGSKEITPALPVTYLPHARGRAGGVELTCQNTGCSNDVSELLSRTVL